VTRAVSVLKGLVALVALVALIGAVPWALWHYVGWPLPHHLPSWSQFTTTLGQDGIADSTLLKALAWVVWLCWAILAVSVVVELDAAARGRAARRLAVIGPLQPLVGQLLAAIVVAAVALTPRPGVAPRPLAAAVPPGRRPVAVAAVALVSDPSPAPMPTTAASAQPSAGGQQAGSTYVVQRNDTLWGIAERELGDPLRWTEIYALNEGRPEPGGATFEDPNWIYPGWALLLPATTSSSPAPAVPAAPPSAPPPTEPSPPAAPTSPTTSPPHRAVGAPNHGKHEAAAAASVVELPSGSVVALSFAAGVLSAIAIGRLRRRHGYRASPPQPGRALGPPPLGPTIRRLAAALTAPDDETDTGAADEQPRFEDDAPSLPEDDAAHRERPDLLEIGERDGTNVTAMLSELGGIALHGDGADNVARAWVAALLTRSGSIAAEVLLTTDTMGRLFRGLGEVAGIRVVEGSEQVVRILEAEALGRTRKLGAEELDDVVAYRQANPAEPIPSVLAVIDAVPDGWTGRLRSTLEVGAHLGIGALFLDEAEAAAIRLELDHGRVVAVEPPDRVRDLLSARLFSLDAAEATDALGVLARAEFRPTSEANPEWTEVIERMEHPPPTTEPWPDKAVERRAAEAPVAVQVLGPLTITVCGKTIGRGLRSVAKELLTFYLLHPEGASVEQAVHTLWPDTDPSQVHRQFWTAAANLRTRLREATDTEAKVLDQAGEVYRLDSEVVSADLWEFQHALADAARAPDDEGAAVALRRAVEAFGGDLVQGSGWLWVEPARQDLHRRAVDAHLRLAEVEEGLGNAAAAEAVLERVVDLDRYGEEPYRRLMILQAKTGRIDAVKSTWRLLQRRLLDLDLDPDPSSGQLYRSFTEADSRSDGIAARQPRPGSGRISKDL
jgi:DNA-binding SARP family transcriptional activator